MSSVGSVFFPTDPKCFFTSVTPSVSPVEHLFFACLLCEPSQHAALPQDQLDTSSGSVSVF